MGNTYRGDGETGHCREAQMQSTKLQQLRDYWDGLRAGRVAPYRSELDPRKFEDALEYMFILEQLNPAQLRVRLAGVRLCELMGMEMRGMPPESFIDGEDREAFLDQLGTVLSTPAVGELDLLVNDNAGKAINAKMLLLPLRSDFGEVTRILGCVDVPRQVSYPPVAFAIADQRTFAITPTTDQEPDIALPGFAESRKAYSPAPNSAPILRSIEGNPEAARTSDRAQLRLVKNG